MKTTIAEVAKHLNVSPATVSRVLNKHQSVNEETRLRVEQYLKEIDFSPVRVSRKNSRQKAVLILTRTSNENYNSVFIDGFSAILRKEGCLVFLAHSSFSEQLEEQYIAYAAVNHFSGIVLVRPVETPTLRQALPKVSCPVLVVNRQFRALDLNCICLDNYRAGYMAAEYLIQMGHRKIACCAGISGTLNSTDHVAGLIAAMNDASLPVNSNLIMYRDVKYDDGYQLGKELVAKCMDCTAIFFGNHDVARAFCDSVEEEGLHVPEDISVIAVAPSPIVTKSGLHLTIITLQNMADFCRTAADVLIERMHRQAEVPRKVIFPPQLIAFDSVKCLHKNRPFNGVYNKQDKS